MQNGWLPLRYARHLGAATAESGKAKRVLFWVKGYGVDFGKVYLGLTTRRTQKRLIAVAENSRGMKVVAFQPIPRGPYTIRRLDRQRSRR
jgi:hypothetical protein